MNQARLLQAGEVAVILGMPSGRSFLARLPRLRGHGFPATVPGCGRRWDRRAVEAWLDRCAAREDPGGTQGGHPGEELIRRIYSGDLFRTATGGNP